MSRDQMENVVYEYGPFLERMIEAGFAENPFQAAHIFIGLGMEYLTDAKRMERAEIYRRWRKHGKSSQEAYSRAIIGMRPRGRFKKQVKR
jgi:hypothetical protein